MLSMFSFHFLHQRQGATCLIECSKSLLHQGLQIKPSVNMLRTLMQAEGAFSLLCVKYCHLSKLPEKNLAKLGLNVISLREEAVSPGLAVPTRSQHIWRLDHASSWSGCSNVLGRNCTADTLYPTVSTAPRGTSWGRRVVHTVAVFSCFSAVLGAKCHSVLCSATFVFLYYSSKIFITSHIFPELVGKKWQYPIRI